MTKREAYRLCHVYPDKELSFSHQSGMITYSGVIRKFDKKECNNYYPFTVEVKGEAQHKNGITTMHIDRRYRTVEEAVVAIFNLFKENTADKVKYNKLEDILFGEE